MQAGYTSIRAGEHIVILSLSITVIDREDGSVEAQAEDELAFGNTRDEAIAKLFTQLGTYKRFRVHY